MNYCTLEKFLLRKFKFEMFYVCMHVAFSSNPPQHLYLLTFNSDFPHTGFLRILNFLLCREHLYCPLIRTHYSVTTNMLVIRIIAIARTYNSYNNLRIHKHSQYFLTLVFLTKCSLHFCPHDVHIQLNSQKTKQFIDWSQLYKSRLVSSPPMIL